MHRTIIALVTALFLASAASASFAVYVDDNGPPTDVILATEIVLAANSYTDEIPATGYSRLFSEFDDRENVMLVISNGDVWIVDETSASSEVVTALIRASEDLTIDATYSTDVPELLEREPNDETNDNEARADDPGTDASESDETGPGNDTVSDGSMGADPNGSEVVSGDPADDGSEPDVSEERGFWGRIVHALFGWMRR